MTPLFASPLMEVHLDLDTDKLTELAFEMQNKDKKGADHTNRGGWQSNNIINEKHEEFIRLKKEIDQYLQIYHSEIFQGMEFKGNVTQQLFTMWININEKHHYNEWHTHAFSTLSGVFYIKHDGSKELGAISFRHPAAGGFMRFIHWPVGIVTKSNEITSEIAGSGHESNTLLIFPSWLEHKVGNNLKDDTRISLSFNSNIISEKKS